MAARVDLLRASGAPHVARGFDGDDVAAGELTVRDVAAAAGVRGGEAEIARMPRASTRPARSATGRASAS